jgi:hypothetical protein
MAIVPVSRATGGEGRFWVAVWHAAEEDGATISDQLVMGYLGPQMLAWAGS